MHGEDEMLSRLDKLEMEIANGITRGDDTDRIRRDITQYFVPGEFWDIHDRLMARRELQSQLEQAKSDLVRSGKATEEGVS